MGSAEPVAGTIAEAEERGPKPGVHKGVDFDTYASWEAINHSVLRHLRRSPAHARNAMLHGVEPTVAMDLGRAVHVAILEPDRFDGEYAVAPQVDRRTKAGKAAYAAWVADTAGRTAIAPDDMRLCGALRVAIDKHETARALLRCPGTSEASLLGTLGGARAKGRLDRIAVPGPKAPQDVAGWVWIVDVKTAPDAGPRWNKDVANYGYHTAAAWYLDLLEAVAPGPERRFAWVVLEKNPPFAVAVYEPTEELLAQARHENEAALRTYLECVSTGSWPGYPNGLLPLDLPRWAQREIAS